MKKTFVSLLLLCLIHINSIAQTASSAPLKIFEIYCSDVNKRSGDALNIVKQYDEDIITVKVYSDKVTLNSHAFGWIITFSKICKYATSSDNWETEDGKSTPVVSDMYYCGGKSLSYWRCSQNGIMAKPLLQIIFSDKECYNFNVSYGQIYVPNTRKWEYGNAATAKSKDSDKIRMQFRHHIGMKFCSNFTPALEDKLSHPADPWN